MPIQATCISIRNMNHITTPLSLSTTSSQLISSTLGHNLSAESGTPAATGRDCLETVDELSNGYEAQLYVNLSTFWYCFLALITAFGLMVSLVSNMIIIYLFTKTPYLRRNPTNIIAVNLSLSDLLYCAQWPSVIYCSLSQSTWILEISFVCETFGFLTVSTALASILTVLAMSIERAIVITYSIHAKSRFTIRGAWCIVLFIWIVSICSCLPPLFGKFNRYTLDPSKTSCTLDYLSSKANHKLYILVLYVAYWIVPAIIIIICYAMIIVTFKRSSKNLRLVGDTATSGGAMPAYDSQSVHESIEAATPATPATIMTTSSQPSQQQQSKPQQLWLASKASVFDFKVVPISGRRTLRDSIKLNRFISASFRHRHSAKSQTKPSAARSGSSAWSSEEALGVGVTSARQLIKSVESNYFTGVGVGVGVGDGVGDGVGSCSSLKVQSSDNLPGLVGLRQETLAAPVAPRTPLAKPVGIARSRTFQEIRLPAPAACRSRRRQSSNAPANPNLSRMTVAVSMASAAPHSKPMTRGNKLVSTISHLVMSNHGEQLAAASNDELPATTSTSTSNSTACHIGTSSAQHSRTGVQIRLAKMSFYLILLWLVSWTPIASLAMINSVFKCHHRASALAVFTANTMTKLGPTFDVFIYGISHPKIKIKFKQIIKWLLMIGRTRSIQEQPKRISSVRTCANRM